MSEPKNYSASTEPSDRTVLCAELPSDTDEPLWRASDDALGRLVLIALEDAGIPVQVPVKDVTVRRLRHAYPVYRRGYQTDFAALDRYLDGMESILSFGRQGLFVHDNTHHALAMGYAAADCLDRDGRLDRQNWSAYRRVFESHVVEE